MTRLMMTSVCVAALIGISACAMPQHRAGSAAPGMACQGMACHGMGQIDRYCVKHTGTRLIVEDDRADKTRTFRNACVDAGGRVYTREQIESTGEVDLADALRKLDPSIY